MNDFSKFMSCLFMGFLGGVSSFELRVMDPGRKTRFECVRPHRLHRQFSVVFNMKQSSRAVF